jgi:E3 ubiquitin-protein ligase HERC2|tara:strand:- start:719 stop:1321 length:603 start_codon:yes stop_codon:yes gene_type:complete
MELCERGAEIEVSFHNRRRYCALVRRARLEEATLQARAVMRGLGSILPVRLLALFSARELELMTCGQADIDIVELRKHTRYGVGENPTASHFNILWEVLHSLSAEQRTLFLSFIWARNRLPPTEEEWGEQTMKLHTLESPAPDGHLPVTHTCFFSMEWPRYSSALIAKRKLIYAITHCTAIDADQTREGRANMAISLDLA